MVPKRSTVSEAAEHTCVFEADGAGGGGHGGAVAE
jgi:hypothetical protein